MRYKEDMHGEVTGSYKPHMHEKLHELNFDDITMSMAALVE